MQTSNNSMTQQAMKDIAETVGSMNRQLNVRQIKNIVVEFERQSRSHGHVGGHDD